MYYINLLATKRHSFFKNELHSRGIEAHKNKKNIVSGISEGKRGQRAAEYYINKYVLQLKI